MEAVLVSHGGDRRRRGTDTIAKVARRTGWLALGAVAAGFVVLTSAAMAWQLWVAVRDGKPGDVILAAALGAATLLFWAWIALGSWHGAYPPVDPETGRAVVPAPVGPWGWVGRFLVVAMVAGFAVVAVWADRAGRQRDASVERVRRAADRIARQRDLTVTQVSQARTAFDSWAVTTGASSDQRPNPLDQLLPVPGASVQDAVVEDGHAAVLVRPDEAPPCVVVDIDEANLVTTRISSRC